MKSLLTKKVIIIFSVLIVIVLTAIILAYATGNTRYPSLSDPDGVFYERLNADGKVIYDITNEELFTEIKGNDGVDQSLYMVDTYLLKSYLDKLTDEQIQTKILELTYGTADPDEIAALDEATKKDYEDAYNQSIVLAGYEGKEEEFVTIILARELYTRYIIDFNKEITDMDVASEFVNSYFEDIQAIRIRFTSSADALNVLHKYNLLTYNLSSLREYLGYIYTSEALLDNNDEVVQAYTTVTPYYFDENNNILNNSGVTLYTLGENNIYTDSSNKEYTLDETGNLLNIDLDVIIANTLIFSSAEDAAAYKEANTVYYSVVKTDAFDMNENARVLNSEDQVVYTIDSDGKIYDASSNDVTDTTDLIVNKVYTEISHVSTTTLNNSKELSNQEVLAKYIAMYNYVYGEYRDLLPTDADVDALIALDRADLTFNYDTVYKAQSSLAGYMFKTLDLTDEDKLPFSYSPKAYAGTYDDSYYLVYKLYQPEKVAAFEIMLDSIEERLGVPSQIATSITLPTSGWYNSTIVWYTSNSAILATDGTVTTPSEDTAVTLTYTITANGVTRSGTILVTVLASGSNADVTTYTDEEPTFKTILNNDTLFDELYNQLIDDMVKGTNAEKNITSSMVKLRQEYDFTLYDKYIQVDYQATDTDYVINTKGDKKVFLSVSGRPGEENAAYEVTADEFFSYVMTKNPSLYLVYASQYKELIYSSYFEEVFGSQTDISKNKSDRMKEMYTSVNDIKNYYASLESLYASYGMAFAYDSFADYTYSQYGTKTEGELLAYFVQSTLQPYLIDQAISDYGLVELLYPTIQDYFNNYFSLNVNHLVIYVDRDEDGTADDYFEFADSLTTAEYDDFETLLSGLLAVIDVYDDYEQVVKDYEAATRDDETWGTYKQAGIYILWEDLNQVDDDDVSHSLTYSGEYGVKDSYVKEYVDELIQLYQDYNLDQNLELETMDGTVITEYGFHVIQVSKGDDFERPSCTYAEEDSANPKYSVGSENSNDMPSLDQLQLYATYFFYSTVYDLSDADIESKYGITVPEIPATVSTALEFYFDTELQKLYVLGTINVLMADSLPDGNFLSNDYCEKTSTQLLYDLSQIKDVYYTALYGDYVTYNESQND